MTRKMRPADIALALWPGLMLATIGTVGFLSLLDAVLESERLASLDQPLLEWLAGHRTEGLTAFFTVVTAVFGPVLLPCIVAVVALVWWRRTRRWWEPAVLVGAMVLSTSLTVVLKAAVGRARPAADLMSIPGYETSGSFPSGHTIGAATLVLVVGYLLWHDDGHSPWARAAWFAMSVVVIGLVALSRLYLGYHFLTDVIAGVCVALVVLGAVVAIERWHDLWLERRDPTPRPLPLGEVDAGTADDDGPGDPRDRG